LICLAGNAKPLWRNVVRLATACIILATAKDTQALSAEMIAKANAATYQALSGAVTDQAGHPIASASVNVQAIDPGISVSDIQVVTDNRGNYRWLLLPGRYSVSVGKDGFERITHTITIQPGQDAHIDFILKVSR
jgi:Carboxypeptidase regulatory-like domain